MEPGRAPEDSRRTKEEATSRPEEAPGAAAAMEKVPISAGTSDAGTGEAARGGAIPEEASVSGQGGGETSEDVSDMRRYAQGGSLFTFSFSLRTGSGVVLLPSCSQPKPPFILAVSLRHAVCFAQNPGPV